MSSLHRALEAFTEQNPDLLRLESLLSKFNLFEAIGVIRQELRHSDFLAYLLDPSRNHGLGSTFLREFLQAVRLKTEDSRTLPLVDLDALNLSQAVVFREWHHVDILVIDDLNRFAVIIENKIDTGEHSDQLNHYHADFYRHYPGYKVVPLYLTPDGEAPTSDDYHAVGYTLICGVIEKIAQINRATLDGEIVMVLEHYAQMLRRHILSESDVAELCRSIYQKHRQALDLIFEHRPDQQAQIRQYVKSLVLDQPGMRFYADCKTWVNFSLQEWDEAFKTRGLSLTGAASPYLCFQNQPNNLNVGIWISPGDQADRQKLLQMAEKHLLTGVPNKLRGREWSQVSSFTMLNSKDYEKPEEEIEVLISEKWAEFMRDELPRIAKSVREEEWLWTR